MKEELIKLLFDLVDSYNAGDERVKASDYIKAVQEIAKLSHSYDKDEEPDQSEDVDKYKLNI